MAAIHTSGSLACFIFGGIIIMIGVFYLLGTAGTFDPTGSFVLAGFGAGLIALGWYIGVLSKN